MIQIMRTTVTLDPDVEQLIRRRMRERNQSFKEAINDAIREGALSLSSGRSVFKTETEAMGKPVVSLDRALQLAGELEDEELIRRMQVGS
jgi:hypothetical protein